MKSNNYEENVFINCPFDDEYKILFNAIVFAIHDCGFIARCALEKDNASQTRIDKIIKIISECKFGIHDLSRTEPDSINSLPRFNMPLELGIFLGAALLGAKRQKEKVCLVFDKEKYRYQKFCSDISGQDVKAHDEDIEKAITITRDWLQNNQTMKNVIIPSGLIIFQRYESFRKDLPEICKESNLDENKLIFKDITHIISEWLIKNDWKY